MWAINNNTPFAAERTWVRDKDGAEVWLVAVKATFNFNEQGDVVLADEQEEIHRALEFFGDPEKTGLKFDTDFAFGKPNTDVILLGNAYAPNNLATPQCEVSLRVANIDKTLLITGDRILQDTPSGIVASDPEPFVKMPLVYERAYGGIDVSSDDEKYHDYEKQNPVGTGFLMREEHQPECRLPNIEYPDAVFSKWDERPKPAGFGPIARHWSPRLEYAGTYDEKWENERQPLFPEDYQDFYAQQAPEDQQVHGYLKGAEFVELIGLTKTGYLRFQIPYVHLGYKTYFSDGSELIHHSQLHSVRIEPEKEQFTVTWLAELPCHHKVQKLLYTDINWKELNKDSEVEPNSLFDRSEVGQLSS